MIDRGALVLGVATAGVYRGVHRPPLDAQAFTGRRGKDLARRYQEAIVAGEGVLEDLDEAIALRDAVARLGIEGLDVVVFEVPRDGSERGLPMAIAPPADGLTLLGYDVIEPMEPFWSPLARGEAIDGVPRNAHGLIQGRGDAARARELLSVNADVDEPLVVVRVWVTAPFMAA